MRDRPDTKSYIRFLGWIQRNGERLPKRHGDWFRAKVLGCDLIHDSWNGGIWIYPNGAEQSGNDVYGNVVCFHGKRELLAIDFDRFYQSARMDFWRIHAEMGL